MRATTALRRIGAGVVAVTLVGGAAIVSVKLLRHEIQPPPSCLVSDGTTTHTLDVDQAANAATIAAVGKRLGLPDHAVTVALAAALQESQLHNLDYGDRDSLGLFQQRPSQGWGSASQILTPSYAAAAFFLALGRVDGWESLPITDAAQRVQRSGAPTAYAQWEPEARTLAIALTGETAAGVACRFALPRTKDPVPTVGATMGAELGVSALDSTFTSARGWTVASWLVAHAQQFRITNVSFGNREWRASTGKWRITKTSDDHVRIVQQSPET